MTFHPDLEFAHRVHDALATRYIMTAPATSTFEVWCASVPYSVVDDVLEARCYDLESLAGRVPADFRESIDRVASKFHLEWARIRYIRRRRLEDRCTS